MTFAHPTRRTGAGEQGFPQVCLIRRSSRAHDFRDRLRGKQTPSSDVSRGSLHEIFVERVFFVWSLPGEGVGWRWRSLIRWLILMQVFHCHAGVIQRASGSRLTGGRLISVALTSTPEVAEATTDVILATTSGRFYCCPPEALDDYFDQATFLVALTAAEVLPNAQEGRTLTFAIPRAVPRELMAAVVAYVLAPFVSLGMSVYVDIETTEASDGLSNSHAHVLISLRPDRKSGLRTERAGVEPVLFAGRGPLLPCRGRRPVDARMCIDRTARPFGSPEQPTARSRSSGTTTACGILEAPSEGRGGQADRGALPGGGARMPRWPRRGRTQRTNAIRPD